MLDYLLLYTKYLLLNLLYYFLHKLMYLHFLYMVLHLYYYEDYSVREIAALLSVREGSVKTRLSRARAMLKEILKEDWADDDKF